MDLLLIPSHKQSFHTQRRNPMKLRMAGQHTGRGNPQEAQRERELGGTRAAAKLRGWLGGEAFPALEQQMCSSQKAPTHCAPRLPAQSCRHQGASLESGSAGTLQAAQPGSISHCWAPPRAWDSQQQWPLTHPVNMNAIPMNQTNNASTFHYLPLAEDHLTRTDEQIHCK